jgi:hypothetical protein
VIVSPTSGLPAVPPVLFVAAILVVVEAVGATLSTVTLKLGVVLLTALSVAVTV